MELTFFDQPEFLMAGIPVKDGSFNDNRIWVYHRLSLSLIEFVFMGAIGESDFHAKQKDFTYIRKDLQVESWKGVFVQNNCESTEKNADFVLQSAWEYLENYLKWEDNK